MRFFSSVERVYEKVPQNQINEFRTLLSKVINFKASRRKILIYLVLAFFGTRISLFQIALILSAWNKAWSQMKLFQPPRGMM